MSPSFHSKSNGAKLSFILGVSGQYKHSYQPGSPDSINPAKDRPLNSDLTYLDITASSQTANMHICTIYYMDYGQYHCILLPLYYYYYYYYYYCDDPVYLHVQNICLCICMCIRIIKTTKYMYMSAISQTIVMELRITTDCYETYHRPSAQVDLVCMGGSSTIEIIFS